ncbi:MAG: sulfatase-like hydrolase/transferase [Verrucomicrobia bacterium]|nr:sulfatase-like hydrolase/transferase [Verrucomicrobiota bacterium]
MITSLRFAIVAAQAVIGLAASAAGDTASAVVSKPFPNIVFILADDLGYGDVGCYNPEAKAPTANLDRLAKEGLLFADAHSPSTVCTPSRYSILTGRMAFRTGMKSVFSGVGGPCLIEPERLTLPGMLRAKGYTTALFGKWHVGMTFFDQDGAAIRNGDIEGVKRIDYSYAIPDAPIHRGFDRFFGTVCCPTTDWLYAFVDGDRVPVPPTGRIDKAVLGLPTHVYSRDCRAGLIAPDFNLEEVDMIFLDKSERFLEQQVRENPGKPFFLFHSCQAVHQPSFPGKDFKGKTKAGPHGDFIFEFDAIVGRLLDKLQQLGVADNTLVIVSSDNGPEIDAIVNMRKDYGHDGARPWRGIKRDDWEGGHRVPMIARWPGRIKPGTRTAQTICLTDLMATCAALVGARLPDNAGEDSVNMLPVLLGKDGGKPIREFTLHQTISLALAIREGKWKYLDHKGSGGNRYDTPDLAPYALEEKSPAAPGQLYDLEQDPGETNNLYFKHPEVVKRLKAKLDQAKKSGRSVPPPSTISQAE